MENVYIGVIKSDFHDDRTARDNYRGFYVDYYNCSTYRGDWNVICISRQGMAGRVKGRWVMSDTNLQRLRVRAKKFIRKYIRSENGIQNKINGKNSGN